MSGHHSATSRATPGSLPSSENRGEKAIRSEGRGRGMEMRIGWNFTFGTVGGSCTWVDSTRHRLLQGQSTMLDIKNLAQYFSCLANH